MSGIGSGANNSPMRLVFLNYTGDQEYDDPLHWLEKLAPTAGILRSLARTHFVAGIEHIGYEGSFEHDGVRYYFSQLRRKRVRFPWKLHQRVRQLNPDVVFVNGFIFPRQVIQLRYQLPRGVKIFVINHAERPASGLIGMLQRIADSSVTGYLFTTKELAEEWVGRLIISQRSKVHEVMEASSIFSATGKEKIDFKKGRRREKTYLWVGRLDDNKDPVTVLAAFARFSRLEPDARLFMIYHSNELEGKARTFCRQERIEHAIRFVGRVRHQDMGDWYSSAGFIISGSHYEGSGIAVCEAMSCGCIPLLTDIPSFRKMTGNGRCGYLYPPGDVPALFGVLCMTRDIEMELERRKTIEQFESEMSFDAIARKIDCLLRDMGGSN